MSSVDVRCSSSLYLWIVFSFMLLRLSNVTRSSRSLLKQVSRGSFFAVLFGFVFWCVFFMLLALVLGPVLGYF